MMKKIDLESLKNNPEFQVIARPDKNKLLIIPRPHKTKWSEDELCFRSLVTDNEGNVLSAGWPKFFNYGENPEHDKSFEEAYEAGHVTFRSKIDGSLIILDKVDDTHVSIRTRENMHVENFEKDIKSLPCYPEVERIISSKGNESFSFLFEYVSPKAPLTVRYTAPDLYFLGVVDKKNLKAYPCTGNLGEDYFKGSTSYTSQVQAFGKTAQEALSHIRAMKDTEGVVASWTTPSGESRMLKIKTDWYLKNQHRALTFGQKGFANVAFLLDIKDNAEVVTKFMGAGFDYETATYAREVLGEYLERRKAFVDKYNLFKTYLLSLPDAPRNEQISSIREFQAKNVDFSENLWFTIGTKFLSKANDEELMLLLCAHALDVPVPSARAWNKDPNKELKKYLKE
jgi:RNA ligase